jgi:predicted transglutaminase-like cysteine proteinase
MQIRRHLWQLVLCLGLLAAAAAPASATQRATLGVSLAAAFQPGQGSSAAVAKKWDRVLAKIAPGTAACPASAPECKDWHRLKKGVAGIGDRMTLLKRINDAVNRLDYVTDNELWALNDYWASPAEFLARGAGDCEDYAISKYFLLRELGVPAEAMRIAIVLDTARKLTHAVLIVQTERGPVVLDNVVEQILPAGSVPQYRTLLALTQGSMTAYLATSSGSAAGG